MQFIEAEFPHMQTMLGEDCWIFKQIKIDCVALRTEMTEEFDKQFIKSAFHYWLWSTTCLLFLLDKMYSVYSLHQIYECM